MGLTYHFTFGAPAQTPPGVLFEFLKKVERRAQKIGFQPTAVLNAEFDTDERKQFARRLTTGYRIQDARLVGAGIPGDGRAWHFDRRAGVCCLPPTRGVVLVATDEWRQETIFGFFQFPECVCDSQGRVVAETGLNGAWYFCDSVKSPEPRLRNIVKEFAVAGYLLQEQDDFLCAIA